jgi:hypothetical protein
VICTAQLLLFGGHIKGSEIGRACVAGGDSRSTLYTGFW